MPVVRVLVWWLAGALQSWAAKDLATANDPWFAARVWQAEDGLPENRIVGVAQGEDGYLWVATQVGTVRFDGVRFQPVVASETDFSFHGTMRALIGDGKRGLWLAKEGGVIIRIADHKIRTLSSENGLLLNETQTSLAQDDDGALWIVYASGKVVRWADERAVEMGMEEGVPEGSGGSLAVDTMGSVWLEKGGSVGRFKEGRFAEWRQFGSEGVKIASARGGGLWICAGQQLYKANGSDALQLWGTFAVPEGTAPSAAAPSVVFEDHAGTVWVGTASAGLFRMDGHGAVKVETSHPDILCLTEDLEGNLWAGTRGGGLNQIYRRVASMITPASGLPLDGVQSVCSDASGALWAVGLSGALARRTGEQWIRQAAEENPDLFYNCVTADSAGNVWTGTRNGAIYRWSDNRWSDAGLRTRVGNQSIRSLLVARTGDLWIGTNGMEALFRYSPVTDQIRRFDLPPGFRFIRALTEDASGAVWAGATDGLLARISGDGLIDLSTITDRHSVRCLHGAANGDVWIGFSGRGVGRWRAGKFVRFGPDEGLPNAYISQILTDKRGSVWLAGNQGIFEIGSTEFEAVAAGDAAYVTPVVYGRNAGMSGLQASFDYSPASVHAGGNRLYFSMLTGLAEVRLDHAILNPAAPPVVIESVTADGIRLAVSPTPALTGARGSARLPSVRAPGELNFPPGLKSIAFQYTGLSFTAPERVRFRYQLEGLDAQWVDAGSRRVAEYAHLPPGRYCFRVTACNNDGLWNEAGASLTFNIAAFFWETLWFKSATLLFGTGILCSLVALGLRRRHRREMQQLEQRRALEQERARIARDLHDELGVGLTEIGLLGDLAGMSPGLTEPTQERLQEIAGRARGLAVSLDEIVWAINPANNSSLSLVDYFFPYAQKLLGQAGVRCRLNVKEPLPPGTLNSEERHEVFHAFKESLNNVIRHARATEVQITLSATEQELMLRTADNGCGLEASAGSVSRHGLLGMQGRLQHLGGRCEIACPASGGTTVTFILPVHPPVNQ